ncbi:MAG: HEAT repeat domain-containing protein [Armatimonadota bacterium]
MKIEMFCLAIWLSLVLPAFAQPEIVQPDPTSEFNKAVQQLKTEKESHKRANAAYRLGQLNRVEAVPPLVEALLNDQADVARACAEALLKLNDKRAIPALLQAIDKFENDLNACPAILRALIAFADPSMKARVVKLFGNRWPAIVSLALTALETLKDPTVVRDVLPLIQPSPDLQRDGIAGRAALYAGRMGGREAVPLIIILLNDGRRPMTRIYAAQALGMLKDSQAIEPLTQALGDADPGVRLAVVDALYVFRKPELYICFALALRDSDPLLRAHGACALGDCKTEKAVPLLAKALHDEDAGVRTAAADALGAYGEAAVEEVLPLVADPSPEVRAAAAHALGAAGLPVSVTGLVRLLADGSRPVRAAAVTALAQLKPAPINAVLPYLKHESPEARARAVEALGRMRENTAALLMPALSDHSPDVRRWALWALGEKQTTLPEVVLANGLNDPNYTVRCETARLAGKLKATGATARLAEMAKLGLPEERMAAYTALVAITGRNLGPNPQEWQL